MTVSQIVRDGSRQIVTIIELIAFILLPLLFIWAIKLNVYSRFPASLFRWIMITDWIQATFRLIQWVPFLHATSYLDIGGSHWSDATCRTVAFIDTTLLLVNLFFTTCVVGSIFWMVCLEKRFTSLARAALPTLTRGIVWLSSMIVAGIVIFESGLNSSLGFCIGSDVSILVKLIVAYLLLGIQALLFVPSMITILTTAARTKTKLSAGSYQFIAFVLAEAVTVLPTLILEFLTLTHQSRPLFLVWLMILAAPICHLFKSALFGRHLWIQYLASKEQLKGRLGSTNASVGEGSTGIVPETPALGPSNRRRTLATTLRRSQLNLNTEKDGTSSITTTTAPTAPTETFAWTDRRNTMRLLGGFEHLKFNPSPHSAQNSPVNRGVPAKETEDATASSPPSSAALPPQIERGSSDPTTTRVAHVTTRTQMVRPVAMHLGVAIPTELPSTPSHGINSTSGPRPAGDIHLLTPYTPATNDSSFMLPPHIQPNASPTVKDDSALPVLLGSSSVHSRTASRRVRGPSLTAEEFAAVQRSLHPSKRASTSHRSSPSPTSSISPTSTVISPNFGRFQTPTAAAASARVPIQQPALSSQDGPTKQPASPATFNPQTVFAGLHQTRRGRKRATDSAVRNNGTESGGSSSDTSASHSAFPPSSPRGTLPSSSVGGMQGQFSPSLKPARSSLMSVVTSGSAEGSSRSSMSADEETVLRTHLMQIDATMETGHLVGQHAKQLKPSTRQTS